MLLHIPAFLSFLDTGDTKARTSDRRCLKVRRNKRVFQCDVYSEGLAPFSASNI